LRVTNNLILNTILKNLNDNVVRLSKLQEQLSTGKRINKPSDDPVGMTEVLNYRSILSATDQYMRNINRANSNLGITDQALNSIGNIIIRAKEIAMAESSGTANQQTRASSAVEVENLFKEAIQTGNTKIGNTYIFAGYKTDTVPFSSGGIYFGDSGTRQIEVGSNATVTMNVVGSEFLTKDLNPDINGDTALSDLNRGDGVNNGSFTIIDREGNSGTVTFADTSTMDINDVINNINGLAGVNVTATINSQGTGILLTDSSSSPIRRLEVQEVGSGQVAKDLGILGYGFGTTLNGDDLDPELSASTPLSLLKGGDGLTLTSIHIENGSLSSDVDLSSATTIGDVINSITSSGTNSSASISFGGTSLDVVSTNSSTTAVVTEVGSGSSAKDLGIQGAHNVLGCLDVLKEALLNNDVNAIQGTLDQLDGALDRVLSVRADVGARVNRLESTFTNFDSFKLNITDLLSKREDADLIDVITQLTSQQDVFRASLSAASQIAGISLLDFLD